jgi:hypothetical protein
MGLVDQELTIRLTADEFWLRPSSLSASAGMAGFIARRRHEEHIQNCEQIEG